ncbi:MAG: xanthine dehydrogenase family protein molybdopterin-binding subunit [Acetobacteraceae bacterium]|nr:xanthine dehydrogenase family protein molybdopterin-binding subunit [Acetobacteraceae bacterium]
MLDLNIGAPRSRVDGRAKVTGSATYAAEFATPETARGYVVSSGIALGRIARIDTKAALSVPGVIEVFTHQNRPRTASSDRAHQDEVAPPGSPFRPLQSAQIQYSGQPIALVVAENFETARYAATLVEVEYAADGHETDLDRKRAEAYTPPKKRSGISPVPKPRGDADAMLADVPVKIEAEYRHTAEYHNPIELHGTTVEWLGTGKIRVHDKIQGVQNEQSYIAKVFGLSLSDVHVVSPYVGGAFGSGLRPQYQLYLAVMAALALKRSVRVELTRDQMFTHVHRPETINAVAIGALRDGTLQAIRHGAVQGTSRFEDYQEMVVSWSGLLYSCENVKLTYELAKLDIYTPGDMRAPGAPTGVFAIESAMDELAYATGIEPVALRLANYAEADENEGKPHTSKELRAAYQVGAERFGWHRRSPAPRSMREGRDLIGWGMAAGVWEAQMQKTSASAVLTDDGKLEVACATSDIGTGTYTILTQIAADTVGVPMDQVTVKLADSNLPKSPVEGGSWTAASAGSAVQRACATVREKLFAAARGMSGSPLANFAIDHVLFRNGRIELERDATQFVPIVDAMRAAGLERIEAEESASREKIPQLRYSSYTHSAVFVEVRVDEELGVVRVTRVVTAVAAGRILNPKTARSQVIGGVVWGISMALHEEAMTDHRLGRVMNHNLAEYHVSVNADVPDIEVIFVDEHDEKTSPMGVKGVGEIGIVGTPAAVANAIYHATGKRVRDLPITIDKVIG